MTPTAGHDGAVVLHQRIESRKPERIRRRQPRDVGIERVVAEQRRRRLGRDEHLAPDLVAERRHVRDVVGAPGPDHCRRSWVRGDGPSELLGARALRAWHHVDVGYENHVRQELVEEAVILVVDGVDGVQREVARLPRMHVARDRVLAEDGQCEDVLPRQLDDAPRRLGLDDGRARLGRGVAAGRAERVGARVKRRL